MNDIKINNEALNNEPNYSNSDSLAVKHNLDVTFDLPSLFVTSLCKIPASFSALRYHHPLRLIIAIRHMKERDTEKL